jgi:hypothetical protein
MSSNIDIKEAPVANDFNPGIFNLWFFAGLACFAVSTLVIETGVLPDPILGWLLTALTIGLLLVGVRGYIRFLRDAGELVRRIHLDALAFSFGGATVFMLGYRLCERLGALKLDISDPLLVMFSVFALGQWIGVRRFAAEERA